MRHLSRPSLPATFLLPWVLLSTLVVILPAAESGEAATQPIERAVAVLHPTAGNEVAGTVILESQGARVLITAEITGLEPGSTHGIHIHEFGDMRAKDAASAGGHYNPAGHPHGLPEQKTRHAGDLGNLVADDQGRASYRITVDNLSIAGERHPVLGRSLIIHSQADDGSQPTGNAGDRIAQGIIGIANPEAETGTP